MRRNIIAVLLFFAAMPGVVASDEKLLDLEQWFDPSKRANIDGLHQYLLENNVEEITGYDFTTVWRVTPFKVEVKGRKIIWVMSRSRKDGVGCCYFGRRFDFRTQS